MQLMALKAVAAEAYVVEVGVHTVHTNHSSREMPSYKIHVMGTVINSQVGSLCHRKFVVWKPSARRVELTLAGKEHLEYLTREQSYGTTIE